jgi:hypothetical protein
VARSGECAPVLPELSQKGAELLHEDAVAGAGHAGRDERHNLAPGRHQNWREVGRRLDAKRLGDLRLVVAPPLRVVLESSASV